MKRKTFPIILSIALLAVSLPLVAFAATTGASDASVDVQFVLTETDLTSATPPPSGGDGDSGGNPAPAFDGSYIINIPSNISLNHEQEFFVNWAPVGVPDTVQVVVSIDGAQTFPDGEFYLTCGDGSTPSQRLVCNILRGSSTDFDLPLEKVTGPDDVVVAVFRGGSGAAVNYGRVKYGPSYDLDNVAGTYTGTVHFKIEVVED